VDHLSGVFYFFRADTIALNRAKSPGPAVTFVMINMLKRGEFSSKNLNDKHRKTHEKNSFAKGSFVGPLK